MAAKPFASGHLLAAADVNDLVGVYDRSTSTVDVVNTTTETNLWTKTIAASAMSTDRIVRATVIGDYLNNSGVAAALTLKIYLTTTPYIWGDLTTATIAASAVRREFRLTFDLMNLASASSQKLSGVWMLSPATAGSVAGIGDIDGALVTANFGGTSAKDTGTALTLSVSATHGAANANLSIRKQCAFLELL